MFIDYSGTVLVQHQQTIVRILLVQYKQSDNWYFPYVLLDAEESVEDGAVRSISHLLGYDKVELLPDFYEEDQDGRAFHCAQTRPFKIVKHESIAKLGWFSINQSRSKLNNAEGIKIMARAITRITGMAEKHIIKSF